MLSVGEIIDGKYRIVRLIGEGGMGAVYEGDNTRIHRRVAIKVLHPGQSTHAESVARFEREAQAAGRIGSEHIVEVLDLGTLPGGERYMVMEYLDGESLSERIRRFTRLSPEQTAAMTLQLLEALSAAHGADIVHRDLKPDNVYLLNRSRGQADFVKLLDFGISKFSQLSGDGGFSMTRTGAVMGTPYYMAPEQAKGSREIDHRVDIYAVGVILYECVTGEVPFKADTFNQLLFKIVLEEPQPLEELVPGLDRDFIAIVKRAMSRDPKDRFASAREFQQVLQSWTEGRGATSAATAIAPAPLAVSGASVLPVVSPTLGVSDVGGRTAGEWTNTQDDTKKTSAGIIAASVVGALVLVGGAIAAFTHLGATSPEGARNPAASSSAEERRAPPPVAVSAAPTVSAASPDPVLSAEKLPPSASLSAKAAIAAPRSEARAPSRPKSTATSKAAAGPRAPSGPAAQPATPSTPSGRKFRTTL